MSFFVHGWISIEQAPLDLLLTGLTNSAFLAVLSFLGPTLLTLGSSNSEGPCSISKKTKKHSRPHFTTLVFFISQHFCKVLDFHLLFPLNFRFSTRMFLPNMQICLLSWRSILTMVLVMSMKKSKDTPQRLRSLPTSKSNTKLDQVNKYHNFFEKMSIGRINLIR